MKKNNIITFRPTSDLEQLLQTFEKKYPFFNCSSLINNALVEYITKRLYEKDIPA